MGFGANRQHVHGRIQTVDRFLERLDGANGLQVVRQRRLQPHKLFPVLRHAVQQLTVPLQLRKLQADAGSGPAEVFVPERYKLEKIATSEDRKEGATAFREKRPAKFKGR